jgi:hypothetical protein
MNSKPSPSLTHRLGGIALLLTVIVGGAGCQRAQERERVSTPEDQQRRREAQEPARKTDAIVAVEKAAAPKQPPQTTSAPTKEFSFVAQGGQEVIAITKATADGDMHAVVFTPFLAKTDGNLYLAALQSLWNVYGKQRGPFQLEDAQMRASASLGGNAICWRIANPAGDFCIFPTKDSESGRIAALTVWVQ